MPISAGAAALATAGASLLGQGGQMWAQSSMNKKTRQWNEKMYGIQRQDALADWNMQNEYNAPSAQMARYKAAGLNPNLIYGQSQVAPSVRSTDVKPWNPESPLKNFRPEESIQAYQDTRIRTAQVNNLQKQYDLLEAELRNKGLDAANKVLANQTGAFNLKQKQDLAKYVIEAAQEGVRQKKNSADLMSAKVNEIATILPMKKYKFDVFDKEAFQLQLEKLMQDVEMNKKKMGIADQTLLNMMQQYKNMSAIEKKILAETIRTNTQNDINKEQLELLKDGVNPNANSFIMMYRNIIKSFAKRYKPQPETPKDSLIEPAF